MKNRRDVAREEVDELKTGDPLRRPPKHIGANLLYLLQVLGFVVILLAIASLARVVIVVRGLGGIETTKGSENGLGRMAAEMQLFDVEKRRNHAEGFSILGAGPVRREIEDADNRGVAREELEDAVDGGGLGDVEAQRSRMSGPVK